MDGTEGYAIPEGPINFHYVAVNSNDGDVELDEVDMGGSSVEPLFSLIIVVK